MKALSAVLVVFAHSTNLLGYSNCTSGYAYILISAFNLLSRICVPIFFLISGYLMFRKPIVWKTNMKKKVKSLLIPYLFWIFFWIAFEAVGYIIASKYFENIFSYSLLDWGGMIIWNEFPIYSPFWYIRNLFLINLIAPFLRKFIFKFPKLTLVVSLIVWFSPIPHTIRQTVTFILIGGLLVLYLERKSYINNTYLKKAVAISVILLSIVLSFLFTDIEIVRNIVVLILSIDVFFCFKSWNMSDGAKKFIHIISPHVFFIYAFHGKTLSILQKLSTQILPQSNIVILLEFFILPVIILIICIIVSTAYKKLLPRVYTLSTGGR